MILQRQGKFIEEDIVEKQGQDTLEIAYVLAMLNRDGTPWPPSKAEKNCVTHIQERFRKKNVESFYEVAQHGETKGDSKIVSIYCVAKQD